MCIRDSNIGRCRNLAEKTVKLSNSESISIKLDGVNRPNTPVVLNRAVIIFSRADLLHKMKMVLLRILE